MLNKKDIDKEKIVSYLQSDGKILFKEADEVRKKYKGDDIHLRGLIEFSNICKRDCYYCGLRAENKKISRYRLSIDEIIQNVEIGVNLGYKTIVLQSGEDAFYTQNVMCEIIKEIKKYDIALTLSIGERSYEEYKAFRNAGADRYLIRIETTDKNLYKEMHPNMSFENRVECIKNLKKLGFETGTGSIVGLPNQTIESLADDILFFKEIGADMIGIGPFISHPDTPLFNTENKGNFEMSLKVMSLVRLIMPDINIPATTAMETLNPNGRIIALQSGANVIMPNITDVQYRDKYEIYPGKNRLYENAREYKLDIISKVNSIGRKISSSKGFKTDI